MLTGQRLRLRHVVAVVRGDLEEWVSGGENPRLGVIAKPDIAQ